MLIDPKDETWLEIEGRIQKKIASYALQLEKDTTEQETSRIRGSIRALREVLNWPKTDAASAAPPESEIVFGR